MILFDFESPGPGDHWQTAAGRATREACESGWCLHLTAEAPSAARSTLVPADWTPYGELSFRARAANDTAILVWVHAGEGAFWRKVDVHGGDWQDVDLDLGWLRRADGPAPSWSSVTALSFRFRDAGEVWLDDIGLSEGSPLLTAEEIAAVTGGTVTRGQHAAVVSLVPSLDGAALVRSLDAVAEAVLVDLPFLHAPVIPAPLPLASGRTSAMRRWSGSTSGRNSLRGPTYLTIGLGTVRRSAEAEAECATERLPGE